MRPLADITRDAAAATTGPWTHDGHPGDGWQVYGPPQGYDPAFLREPDARFIAAARTDVPEMAAEIERLRKALASALWRLADEYETRSNPRPFPELRAVLHEDADAAHALVMAAAPPPFNPESP